MSKFFESRKAAADHMAMNGWREIKNGRWVSRDKSCAAHILTSRGSAVLVQVWALG